MTYVRLSSLTHCRAVRLECLTYDLQLLLAALEAGVTSSSKLVLELLDAASRIDELQFAGVERVANVADIDFQFLTRAARDKLIAAAAGDLRFEIFGMDVVFHDRLGRLRVALKFTEFAASGQAEAVVQKDRGESRVEIQKVATAWGLADARPQPP